jgi:hypothetical protein
MKILTDQDTSLAAPRRKLWQTILLLAGSAAVGGLAVVIWNRKDLAQMHMANPDPAGEPLPADDEIY